MAKPGAWPSGHRETAMVGFAFRLAVGALALWLASRVVPGVVVRDFETLILAALLLGVVNALLRPIVVVLTLPLTIVSFGLFLVVVNAFLIWLVSRLLPGFVITGFWPAIGAAVVTGLVSALASGLGVNDADAVRRRRLRRRIDDRR